MTREEKIRNVKKETIKLQNELESATDTETLDGLLVYLIAGELKVSRDEARALLNKFRL